jgi:mevalonate pyrophosphate decarboxylase
MHSIAAASFHISGIIAFMTTATAQAFANIAFIKYWGKFCEIPVL